MEKSSIKHCARRHPQCRQEININDPHDRCIRHNITCFVEHNYDPTVCSHCNTLIEGTKAKEQCAAAIFQQRITAMKRSVAQAYKANKLNPVAKARFESSNGQDIFAPHAKHLDPRPRSISPALRPRTPRQDALATAIAETDVPITVEQPATPSALTEAANQFSRTSGTPRAKKAPTPVDSLPPTSDHSDSARDRARRRNKRLFSSSSSPSSEEGRRRCKHKQAKKRKATPPQPDFTALFQSLKESITNDIAQNFATLRAEIQQTQSALASDITKINSRLDMAEGYAQHLPNPSVPQTPATEPEGHRQESVDDYESCNPGYGFRSPKPRSSSPEPYTEVPEEYNTFFWPENCDRYEDAFAFQDIPYYFRDKELEEATHLGQPSFKPLKWCPKVERLVQASCRVIVHKELEEFKKNKFESLSKVINTECYKTYGLSTSSSEPFCLTTSKVSRFASALPEDITHKPANFSLQASPEYESPPPLVAFASAPKLSKDCHHIEGVLINSTTEVSEDLRSKDFQARQNLLSNFFAHETATFIASLVKDTQKQPQPHETSTVVKTVDKVTNYGVLPAIRSSMSNALASCIAIRKELRTEALAKTSPPSVKHALSSGPYMLPGLFHPEAIALAEKCFASQPAKVNVMAIHAPHSIEEVREYPKNQRHQGCSSSFRGTFHKYHQGKKFKDRHSQSGAQSSSFSGSSSMTGG